jgi:transcriptional regulator with XRE-family HTH domain
MKNATKTLYTPENIALTTWLRDNRKAKGLSIRDVAEKMGASHSWLGKIEHRDRRMDVVEFVRICEALEISPYDGIEVVRRVGNKKKKC